MNLEIKYTLKLIYINKLFKCHKFWNMVVIISTRQGKHIRNITCRKGNT